MSTTVDARQDVRVDFVGNFCAYGVERPCCDEFVYDFCGWQCGKVPMHIDIDRIELNGFTVDPGQFLYAQIHNLPDDPVHGMPYFRIHTW